MKMEEQEKNFLAVSAAGACKNLHQTVDGGGRSLRKKRLCV
jgi:hypothetical protein